MKYETVLLDNLIDKVPFEEYCEEYCEYRFDSESPWSCDCPYEIPEDNEEDENGLIDYDEDF